LHGCWIDACQNEATVWNENWTIEKASPIADAEEYVVHDHVGFEEVCELAEFIQEHGRLGGKLVEHNNEVEYVHAAIEKFTTVNIDQCSCRRKAGARSGTHPRELSIIYFGNTKICELA